jgi:hypothetical protein
LGLLNLTYPNNPIGENRDGKPATEFAQKMMGELSAIDGRLQKAFEVGFFGVISINTPEMKPKGFDLKAFALEAGFEENNRISEIDYLESLVKKARSEITQ